jgi:hypothetical protein
MKRSLPWIIILILLAVLGYAAMQRYPKIIPSMFSPYITPIVSIAGQASKPVLVATLQPTIAAPQTIPLPANIPTLDAIKDLVKSANPATLTLSNAWSASITIDFDGLKVTVPSGGTESKQFPPGKFNYTVTTSDCGSPQSDSITLEKSQSYSISFYCSSSGAMFADQVGSGFATLTIYNNSSDVITFSIDNRSYQISPGSLDIYLAPGTYTYSATAPGVFLPSVNTITLFSSDYQSVSFTIR